MVIIDLAVNITTRVTHPAILGKSFTLEGGITSGLSVVALINWNAFSTDAHHVHIGTRDTSDAKMQMGKN